MKFPWQRNTDEEVYLDEKPKKPKETLSQVAEKILMKKMKADPDYGLQAAERIKRISHAEPKTIKDFMQELKEYRDIMSEAGMGGEGKSIIRQILEALPTLPAMFQEANKMRAEMQGQGMTQIFRQPAPQIQETQQPQITEVAEEPKQPRKLDLKLEGIMDLLVLTPQEAFEELQNRNEVGWINYLGITSFETLVEILEKTAEEKPEFAENIKEFLIKQRHWLEELVEIAHGMVKTEE